MYYVTSDIYGEYDRYLAMLEKIHFCDGDILFVLGDVVDRGPEQNRIYYDQEVTVIVGHTPTLAINGKPEIYKSGNVRFMLLCS